MSQFLVAYREFLNAPTSDTALMQLHQIMTGAPAVNGLDEAKVTVKTMVDTLASALTAEGG